MLAERRVDDEVCRLGSTTFQQKGYCHGTREYTVPSILEEKERNNEERGSDNEESSDIEAKIDKYQFCETVLQGDIKEIKEDFTKDMEVMEKLKHFCSHVNDAEAAGAGIANNHEECMQDISTARNRMIALRTNNHEHELGNRNCLRVSFREAKQGFIMCENHDECAPQYLFAGKDNKFICFFHVIDWCTGHEHHDEYGGSQSCGREQGNSHGSGEDDYVS
jgi:hypothetical protein